MHSTGTTKEAQLCTVLEDRVISHTHGGQGLPLCSNYEAISHITHVEYTVSHYTCSTVHTVAVDANTELEDTCTQHMVMNTVCTNIESRGMLLSDPIGTYHNQAGNYPGILRIF